MQKPKGMSDDGTKRESSKSDSGSSEDFDFYGFTNTFAYAVSVLISISLVMSSYGIELYNYSLQAQNWITVYRVVGVVCLFIQALFLSVLVGVGYLRKKDLSVEKE